MIDLPSQDLTTIRRILKKHVPDCEVRAFGSRVSWTARPHSDLDLVILCDEKLPRRVFSALKAEFEDSPIPVIVDLLDWHRISPEFRQNIAKQWETIQTPNESDAVPEGWSFRKVAEIADVIGGGTPKTNKAEYWGGEIPWLTPKDLSGEHPRLISRGERSITKAGLENSSARMVPPKAVLLTSRAPVGYVALAKNPLATNQGFRSLVVKAGHDPEFVFYLLLNNTAYLRHHAAGSTFQELSGTTLKSLEFLVPPLPEQKAIAHVLGTLDDAIELKRQMNDTLEHLARTLYRSWFVDFAPTRAKSQGSWRRGQSLPGLSAGLYDLFPARLVPCRHGEIPDGWRCEPLRSWVEALSGATPSRKDASLWNGELPWISPKVMTAIHVEDSEHHVSEEAIGKGARLAPSGSTLVMVRGMGLHQAVRVSQARCRVAFNQDVKALVPKKIQPTLLLLALLDQQQDLLTQVESAGHGKGRLPSDMLLTLTITMPEAPVQAKLAKYFDALNDCIAANNQESRTLADLRDSLLPKLISGELQLKDAEQILGRAV